MPPYTLGGLNEFFTIPPDTLGSHSYSKVPVGRRRSMSKRLLNVYTILFPKRMNRVEEVHFVPWQASPSQV